MILSTVAGIVTLVASASAAQDTILARHETCVTQGRSSAVCAEVLTGHCLDTSDTFRELTRCRAGLADLLESRASGLAAEIGQRRPHLRAQAIEILAGSDQLVADYCAALGGRMATEDSASHDIRCALMAGHVKVYHLLRLSLGAKEDI